MTTAETPRRVLESVWSAQQPVECPTQQALGIRVIYVTPELRQRIYDALDQSPLTSRGSL